MSCYVIAEAGSNHDCNFDTAKQLVDVAKRSGCDAVKFQIFSAETLYSSETTDFDKYQNVWSLIKSLEVPFSFFRDLKKYCDDVDIQFLATPFSNEAVDLLVEMDVPVVKIASFEFTDRRLVSHIVKTGKPIIASTGLCSKEDIWNFLTWTETVDVTLLHCNSAYPTPDVDANVSAMKSILSLSAGFCKRIKVGLSDHTMGIIAPVVAVSLGASVIEKHFTTSRANKGPDHPFSVEPHELKTMVAYIRQAETLVGNSKLERTESEKSMHYARRSVVSSQKISAGDVFSEANITTKRPGSGIPASLYFDVIGKTAARDLDTDHILGWTDVRV